MSFDLYNLLNSEFLNDFKEKMKELSRNSSSYRAWIGFNFNEKGIKVYKFYCTFYFREVINSPFPFFDKHVSIVNTLIESGNVFFTSNTLPGSGVTFALKLSSDFLPKYCIFYKTSSDNEDLGLKYKIAFENSIGNYHSFFNNQLNVKYYHYTNDALVKEKYNSYLSGLVNEEDTIEFSIVEDCVDLKLDKLILIKKYITKKQDLQYFENDKFAQSLLNDKSLTLVGPGYSIVEGTKSIYLLLINQNLDNNIFDYLESYEQKRFL